jgi:thioredoxin 2
MLTQKFQKARGLRSSMSDNSVFIRCNNCLMVNRVPQEKLSSKPACGNCRSFLEIPRQPVWAKLESFDRAVAYWPETLLVVFTSSSCLYCRIFEPVVNELAAQRIGKLKVMKVDVETDEYLAQRFTVTKTPTFIVYRNGVKIIRVDGAPKEKTDLVKWVDNLINYTSY